MRYAVISKGQTVSEIESLVRQHGGRNIRTAPLLEQVFCDLEPEAASKLDQVSGITVKLVKEVSTKYTDASQVAVPAYEKAGVPVETEAVYSTLLGWTAPGWYELSGMFDPPIIGNDTTIAILDSGMRSSHRSLRGKVVHAKNFTSSPTVEDVFDHGTGVAYCICGGRHLPGEDQGGAPGVGVMNIKVLDDNGVGTEEEVVAGLEEVRELLEYQFSRGKGYTDEMTPGGINMSFGGPDDGDPDNPIRAAIRKTIEYPLELGMGRIPVTVAAGNLGPGPETITSPACDPHVVAVGVLNFVPFSIAEVSSRGPTKEGLIKPDLVWYGMNINVASAASDDSFATKSGSSFSAPYVMGGGCCAWEMLRRYYGIEVVVSSEQWLEMMKGLSMKPQGAPVEKDNTYGYGLPVAEGLIRQVTGMDVPSMMTDIITPVVGLGMMGMVMAGMGKAMKGG